MRVLSLHYPTDWSANKDLWLSEHKLRAMIADPTL